MKETMTAVKAMNKIMYFMTNCSYDDVQKLVYETFDGNLADHIFGKYQEMLEYTRMAFFNLYFELDSECKLKICEYIYNTYNSEQKIVTV